MKKQETLWNAPPIQDIESLTQALCQQLDTLSLGEKITALNGIRRALHEHSPFRDEPVDYVKWVPADSVVGNLYNPNNVAPPEMELLYISIKEDGFTQPIVTYPQPEDSRIVDGFHRNRIGKERKDIKTKIHGHLPIVAINKSLDKRIASTIRHNRARGKHSVTGMVDIVVMLVNEGLSDTEIGKQLGMDADEVLRLKRETGIPELFKNRTYSRSWVLAPEQNEFSQLSNIRPQTY